MPPPRKRPHPRSLDALFGPAKPRVPVPKRCPKGHRQTQRWRAGDDCLECASVERARLRALSAAEVKARYREAMGPPPAVLRILTVDSGKITTYAIPPRLAAERKARDKRRGRRRRSGI